MLWDEPKIFFLERRYFFSIILSEFLKNRVALQLGRKEIDLADYERFLEGYAKLSAKELEVCQALASGLSTRQYAEQAGCAPSTVDTYRKRLYEKTGIHKARQLQLCYALLRMEQLEQEAQ